MGLVTLTFDLLTLQLVCESHDRIKGRDLRSEFGHARPSGSPVIHHVRDGRTDGWTDKSKAYCSLPCGRGHNKPLCVTYVEQFHCATWHFITSTWTLLLCPRPRRGGGGIRRSSASVVRLSVRPSVCLSDVAYIGSNWKTKRPRKTKLCTGVPQVTCDSHTDFKVKRSKVKVGRGNIVAAT